MSKRMQYQMHPKIMEALNSRGKQAPAAKASLGMSVRASGAPANDTGDPDNPAPGTREFGLRAARRQRRLQGKQPITAPRDVELAQKDLKA